MIEVVCIKKTKVDPLGSTNNNRLKPPFLVVGHFQATMDCFVIAVESILSLKDAIGGLSLVMCIVIPV